MGAQAGGEIPPSPAWARVTWQAFEVLYFYMYMCSLAVQPSHQGLDHVIARYQAETERSAQQSPTMVGQSTVSRHGELLDIRY